LSEEVRVGIIGTKFMGRVHSNAWVDVPYYFKLHRKPVLQAACGRNIDDLKVFALNYGWKTIETSWEKLIEREDIDLVDICTFNAIHHDIAVAAARVGKHILCEKPLAMNAQEAKEMHKEADRAGVIHMVSFNYRRVPALCLAKQLIEKGEIGQIRHFNAVYYQDRLVDPDAHYVWRNDSQIAGSGAHGDLNAHTIDLARFMLGEITEVSGAKEIFIKERPLIEGTGTGKVTADDSCYFLARFSNGALGSFLATRIATGRKNYLRLEVFGSQGGLIFNLERINELQLYSRKDSDTIRGFRTIHVTEASHPYLEAWWPGHNIGWERTFIHQARDLVQAITKGEPVQPNFYDGLLCQQVLDAVVRSAEEKTWIKIKDL
jgi:predicted dehydrogenase